MNVIQIAERGWVPDAVVRFGIRRLCESRLREERQFDAHSQGDGKQKRLRELCDSPIAIATEDANRQHYEVPTSFYQAVLGPHMKYSACWWDRTTRNLAEAETAMLELYAERAQLQDGQRVLDMGCGWGSFSLWAAAKYPASEFTAVSNSNSQRLYIEKQAFERGLDNLRVITQDINCLELESRFDRIVSVEMLEHVRNYSRLFERISHWLDRDGKMFVHIFCHKSLLYPFETEGESNWMGRYFFTGGIMPSADTFSFFQHHLRLNQEWQLPGTHYQRTAEAWLHNMDSHKQELRKIAVSTYGEEQADLWIQRWRMFFMACAELFGYRRGSEWLVCHYLFEKDPGGSLIKKEPS